MRYTLQKEGHITCEYKNCGSCRVKEHSVPLLPDDILENYEGVPMCAGCGEMGQHHLETFNLAKNNIHEHCRAKQVASIATRFGGIDGDHHKQWVIDQMLRASLGKEEYDKWVKGMNSDTDYDPWDVGTPP